jgi:hypothetical protein
MSILDDFGQHSGKIELPKDLYAAIDRFGTLPRYHESGGFEGKVYIRHQGTVKIPVALVKDREPAEQDARDIYHHVRAIAIKLLESNPNLTPLPKSETDPFVGIQTIQEWCLDTNAEGSNTEGASSDADDSKDIAIDPNTKEQQWRDDAPEYISNADAVKMGEGKISESGLSDHLRKSGNTIRWMRNKDTRRSKVHVQDFRQYKNILRTPDEFSETAFEIRARQTEIDQKKRLTGK